MVQEPPGQTLQATAKLIGPHHAFGWGFLLDEKADNVI
jgi:hypothetical protein